MSSVSVRERIARLEAKTASPDIKAASRSVVGWGRKPVEVKPLERKPVVDLHKPVLREVSVDKSKPNKMVQREVAEQMLAKTIRERESGKVYTEWHATEIPSDETQRQSDPSETLARIRRISEGGAKGLNSSAMGVGLRNHGQMIATALNNARESDSLKVRAVVSAVESRKRSNANATKDTILKKKNSFKL